MKKLFNKFLKKEPQFNYILAEYQPIKARTPTRDLSIVEFDIGEVDDKDEMEIDRIYQRS